jgi:hypothetical protein
MASMLQLPISQRSNAAPVKHMKPQSQILRQLGAHRRAEMPARVRPTHPETDFAYQATSSNFGVANTKLQHSATPFRHLSQDFLAQEMKRDYVKEAFCFLVIVGLSAWPIGLMVSALSQLK